MRNERTSTSSTTGGFTGMIDSLSRRPANAGLQRTSSMHTSRALLVLSAIGAVLTLGACSCSGSVNNNGNGPGNVGTDGGSDGGAPKACLVPGAACASGVPGCSGVCDGTVFATPSFCQANGDSCNTDT